MNILVCGGRDFTDYVKMRQVLLPLMEKYSKYYDPVDNWLPTDITIVSGGAAGADMYAEDFAIGNFCQLKIFRADWGTHGKAAGPIRNQQMLDETSGGVDLVVAFPTKNSRGTWDMIRRAEKAGIKTIIIKENDT